MEIVIYANRIRICERELTVCELSNFKYNVKNTYVNNRRNKNVSKNK